MINQQYLHRMGTKLAIEAIAGSTNKGEILISTEGVPYYIDNTGVAKTLNTKERVDVLFSGNANTKAITYTLAQDITKYSVIEITAGITSGTVATSVLRVRVSDLVIPKVTQLSIGYFYSSTNNWGMHFGFGTNTSFTIQDIAQVGWTGTAISKIVGIY